MKSLYLFIALFLSISCLSQSMKPALERALLELEKDPQFKHAMIGLFVTNKSGGIVIEKNSEVGMTPASTLKVVTSVTAFESLGKSYQFKTGIAIEGEIKNNTLEGNLHFIGGGDPTLGSNRWASTKNNILFEKVKKMLADKGIKKISGNIIIDEKKFLYPPIPNGWIWEDIGNYYGAGAWGLNWRENKYEVHLSTSAEPGKPAQIVYTSPTTLSKQITNYIQSGAKGSGDNAYLFSAPYSEKIFANGTIPAGEKDFVIYGAVPLPSGVFIDEMGSALGKMFVRENKRASGTVIPETIGFVYSPPLDSINYWFLKESVNLFGEAMVNGIALEQGKKVSTSAGIELLRSFWEKNGIEKSALKMIDGSGLSPANRITPRALTQVLQFAKTRNWYNSFYHALPEMNGIKMKSGYIGGVRSYTGYIRSKTGEEYTFAFIINNFDGPASTVREKMYRVLNLLK